jgi:hypothetical protein
MGDVTVRVTNTLDSGATDESIGYGNMVLHYEFDDGRPVSTGNYDAGVTDPTSLWENNCDASRKTCQLNQYYGGYNECGNGAQFWRTFEKSQMHPGTHQVTLTGRVYTIDSWDGETFTVEMKNSQGEVMDSVQVRGNNFENAADETLQCEGSVGGWQDGYFNIRLSSDYSPSMGDVQVRVTSTLDQGATDESIGIGDMELHYKFDPSVEWVRPSVMDIDEGVEDPMALW